MLTRGLDWGVATGCILPLGWSLGTLSYLKIKLVKSCALRFVYMNKKLSFQLTPKWEMFSPLTSMTVSRKLLLLLTIGETS